MNTDKDQASLSWSARFEDRPHGTGMMLAAVELRQRLGRSFAPRRLEAQRRFTASRGLSAIREAELRRRAFPSWSLGTS